MPRLSTALVFFTCLAFGVTGFAEEEHPLKEGLEDYVADGWIYDDIDKAYAEAKRTGKPILASFR